MSCRFLENSTDPVCRATSEAIVLSASEVSNICLTDLHAGCPRFKSTGMPRPSGAVRPLSVKA